MYYLYSEVKEVTDYIFSSLKKYDLILIEEPSELFKIGRKSLLILHINSYSDNSLELVNHLLKDNKTLRILALSNSVNFIEGTELLQSGVRGYGNVYMHNVHLEQAVEVIMSDNIWIYPELANHLIKNITKNHNIDNNQKLITLSEHEKECAILASDGNTNKEIADLLNVQEITIKKHLSSVYKKLEVRNRIELALYLVNP